MKTREELKAAVLAMEFIIEDGVVDAACPWCGAVGSFKGGGGSDHFDVVMKPHDPKCLWLELKIEVLA